jgi:hypothetical protein
MKDKNKVRGELSGEILVPEGLNARIEENAIIIKKGAEMLR